MGGGGGGGGGVGGERSQEVWRRGKLLNATLAPSDRLCITMGAGVSRWTASLLAGGGGGGGANHNSVHKPQLGKRKGNRSGLEPTSVCLPAESLTTTSNQLTPRRLGVPSVQFGSRWYLRVR